ncbi:hypothetical protein D9M68_823510 [compost metagenome]
MLIRQEPCFGLVLLGEYHVTDDTKARLAPGGEEAIDTVPAVERNAERIVAKHAEHLRKRRRHPFVGAIVGNAPAGAVHVVNEVRRIGQHQVDATIWQGGKNGQAIAQDNTTHGWLLACSNVSRSALHCTGQAGAAHESAVKGRGINSERSERFMPRKPLKMGPRLQSRAQRP